MGYNYLRKVSTVNVDYDNNKDEDIIKFISDYENDNGYFWIDDKKVLFDYYKDACSIEFLIRVHKFFEDNGLYETDLRVEYE